MAGQEGHHVFLFALLSLLSPHLFANAELVRVRGSARSGLLKYEIVGFLWMEILEIAVGEKMKVVIE